MIKGLLQFLFGKNPDIFDAEGNVVHNLPPEKWAAWNKRFLEASYDWRKHKGTERKASSRV